jgi:thiol:disulfide interchange protein DsbD
LATSLSYLAAQSSPAVTVSSGGPVAVKRDAPVTIPLQVQVNPGFHINSDKPLEEYLIPLKLTWDKEVFQTSGIVFPKAEEQKYAFQEKPLSVFTGAFRIESKGKLMPTVMPGKSLLTGKLKYQACNDTMCFQPKTVPISITLDVQ